jgi:hypothetical protein
MWSSLKDFKMQYKVWDKYEEIVTEYYDEQEDIRNRWEDVFASDNGFIFAKGTWLKLLKLGPSIKINDKWVKVKK